MMISAIVLAAGESRRMGTPKQLLKFGESTILKEVINLLLRSKVDEVTVVLGYQSQRIAERIDTKGIKIAVNPDYREGMLSSIKRGLTSVSDRTDALLLALGDQPFIKTCLVNKIIDEYSASDKSIAIPTYEGSRGHPIIVDMKYRDEILSLTGDATLREVIHVHSDDVLEVEVDTQDILRNINTREDYQRELSIWKTKEEV